MTGADMSVIWQIQHRPTARGDDAAQLDNQFMCARRTGIAADRQPRHRFLEPIHNVKDRGLKPLPPANQRISVCFGKTSAGRPAGKPAATGGAYRDRTDDLKLAKLALSQLS